MSATLKPCWEHSLTAFSLGPGLTEVTVFGGSAEPPTRSVETLPKLADTTLLQFSEWLIVITYHYNVYLMISGHCWNMCIVQLIGVTE